MEPVAGSDSVHVSVVDFGMGSVGKFHHIAQHLKDVRFVFDGDAPEDIRTMLQESAGWATRFRSDPDEPEVALVINDPDAANREHRRGRKVVYVDSLPYLWTLESELPKRVEAYCAQRFPGRLASDSPLRGQDIIWIDSIVPARHDVHTGGGGVVISVGGMRGPLMTEAVQDAYIGSVILPLLSSLQARGVRLGNLCGGIPERWHEPLKERSPDLHIRNLPVAEFQCVLARADLLLTSPGSTTMLEAASIGVPTALLPPQNVSQVINATTFAGPQAIALGWPARVLDTGHLQALREKGELAALGYMYDRLVAGGSHLKPMVAGWVTELLAAMRSGSARLRLPPATEGGAQEVAAVVRSILRSARPRFTLGAN